MNKILCGVIATAGLSFALGSFACSSDTTERPRGGSGTGGSGTGGVGTGGVGTGGVGTGGVGTGGVGTGGVGTGGVGTGGVASGGTGGAATGGTGGSADPEAECIQQVLANGQPQACAECMCPAAACQDELRACRDDPGMGGHNCQTIAACANTPGTCCTDPIGCLIGCPTQINTACNNNPLSCQSATVASALSTCRNDNCATPCACVNP
jgi:hypothetical protein